MGIMEMMEMMGVMDRRKRKEKAYGKGIEV